MCALYVCSIIMSRTWGRKFSDDRLFNITGENETTVHTLVPAADMPNHGVGTFEARSSPDGTLVLKSFGHLRYGDHIMISYGKKCNAEFLANYGFVPFNNTKQACWDAVNVTGGKHKSNMTGETLRRLELEQQKNRTEWRERWRGHFARFYGNLQRAQHLAQYDRQGWHKTIANLTKGKNPVANFFFKPIVANEDVGSEAIKAAR